MALFSKKQNSDAAVDAPKAEVAEKTVVKKEASVSVNAGRNLSGVLTNPRITEKAAVLSEGRTYVFDVAPRTTKGEVADAIRRFYKVSPAKVRIVSVPSKTKRSMRTGRTSVLGGGKKAYVFLKEGDSITLA